MATNPRHCWTYKEAAAFLGDRLSRKAPTGSHTYVERLSDSTVGLRYHTTFVIEWHSDGTARLNHGGYWTATTKHRFNNYSRAVVFQKNFEWYLQPTTAAGPDWSADPVAFYRGIKIDQNGNPQEAA